MKTYVGMRAQPTQPGELAELRVVVKRGADTWALPLRLDIRNHSPTGFEAGYGGSGPAQLALALVADCCGVALAVAPIYQRVKKRIVARLPHDGWTIEESQVKEAVAEAMAEAGISSQEAGDRRQETE